MIVHIQALPSLMKSVYPLTFDNQTTANAVELGSIEQIESALASLGMARPKATLVVVGGAGGLTEAYLNCLQDLFTAVICPFAETHQLAVVDGGTDSGVMQLIGQARTTIQATFPLLGVVVRKKTYLPGELPADPDAAPLEPNHTHFLMVPGDNWGDESSWISDVAGAISDDLPSATLLINGGNIALQQDVPNSLDDQRPVLVIAGSGRAADQLAAALQGTDSNAQLKNLVETGLIQSVGLHEGATKVYQAMSKVFNGSL